MRKVMLQKFLMNPNSWNTKRETPKPTVAAEDDDDFVDGTNENVGPRAQM